MPPKPDPTAPMTSQTCLFGPPAAKETHTDHIRHPPPHQIHIAEILQTSRHTNQNKDEITQAMKSLQHLLINQS